MLRVLELIGEDGSEKVERKHEARRARRSLMLSLKLRAILFPFQMEPRREELLHELGVRCPLLHRLRRRSCEISSSPCMPAICSSC